MSKRIGWESVLHWPVYLTAAMLPFSLAATNIAKFLMVVFSVAVLAQASLRRERLQAFARLRTPLVILAMLVLLGLSLAWTEAPPPDALQGMNKYSKLLIIPLVLLLLRERRQAVTALAIYIVAQSFIVLVSCVLSTGTELPWLGVQPVSVRVVAATVTSTYLDQSIMTAGLAALAWHLRHEFPGRHGRWIAIAIFVVCAANVLTMLPGRSAQVALLAAMVLALFWAVPRKARPAAILVPLLVAAGVMALAPHVRDRTNEVVTESIAYQNGDRSPTSSGIRLRLWQHSLEAIAERPVVGHGVGSWNTIYQRLEGRKLTPVFANLHNPHQEYLLWGVQLGIGGIVLLLAFGIALLRDARPFRADVRHATYSVLTILAVVCLFNSTLYDARIGDYFCFLLGVLLALGVLDSPAHEVAA